MNSDVKRIKEVINCDFFLSDISMDIKQIKKYYRASSFAYRKIYSKEGFMHMRVSTDGKLKDEDVLYQVNKADEYLNDKTKDVLELGCGQGANISVLAQRHPGIHFKGVDLSPSIQKRYSNVELFKCDYHHLSMFHDNMFDVILAFETLCYSTNKKRLFEEIFRVLKEGGKLIIYDVYARKKEEMCSDEEKEIMRLVPRGMSVEKFDFVDDGEKYIKDAGFKEVINNDISTLILPTLMNLKNKVEKCIRQGYLFTLICNILPKKFVGNGVAGYLMYKSINERILLYKEQIYTK